MVWSTSWRKDNTVKHMKLHHKEKFDIYVYLSDEKKRHFLGVHSEKLDHFLISGDIPLQKYFINELIVNMIIHI